MTQRLSAQAISVPVLEHIPPGGADGTVVTSGLATALVEVDGFVVAVTTREVPLMPNGISVVQNAGTAAMQRGGRVRLTEDLIEAGEVTVSLAFGERWDPTVAPVEGFTRSEIGRRGRGLLRNCRVPPSADAESMGQSLLDSGLNVGSGDEAPLGVKLLMRAIAERDPEAAGRAGELLIGQGRGPAPEGDFLLAASMVALSVFGGAAGMDESARTAWIDALHLDRARGRTSDLAATLLELALGAMVAEPVHHLLNLDEPPERWRPALHRLLGFGFWAGRSFASGLGATAALLGT